MGMTIDEILAKETEIAQEFQKVIDTHMVSENMSLEEMCCDDTEVIEEHLQRCKVLADYHNQIVDTMRKYQQIEQILKDIPYGGDATLRRIQEVVEDGND